MKGNQTIEEITNPHAAFGEYGIEARTMASSYDHQTKMGFKRKSASRSGNR